MSPGGRWWGNPQLSKGFSKQVPPHFRRRLGEIAGVVAKVTSKTIEDIKFVQAQIRNSTEIQRGRTSRVATLYRVVLSHAHISVEQPERFYLGRPWSHGAGWPPRVANEVIE
jgi:hypothetical protein